jgi:hypothetical protein
MTHRLRSTSPAACHGQRGITLLGLLFWAVVIAAAALVVMRVVPTINEYFTIQRTVEKVAKEGGGTVPEIRAAFDRQKQVEFAIVSISGNDLSITKENEKIVVSFAYAKEIELIAPVSLLIRYSGRSR